MELKGWVGSTSIAVCGLLGSHIWSEHCSKQITPGDEVFVRAQGGTHLDVEGINVQARWMDQGEWQRLTIEKKGQGRVSSGDIVYFKAHTGRWVGVQEDLVQASWPNPVVNGEFLLETTAAGMVAPGDAVTLRAHTGEYLGIRDTSVQIVDSQEPKLVIEKPPSWSRKWIGRCRKAAAAGRVFFARTYEHFTKPSLVAGSVRTLGDASADNLTDYMERVGETLVAWRDTQRKNVTLAAGTHRHVWGTSEIKGAKLDLSMYVHVLGVNRQARYVDVEGRAFFKDVLRFLLDKHNMTLQVIPDMVHLTVGGLYAGIGGGAASFKSAAFHHSVLEVDVLVSTGEVLTCSATQHADLFAALPGSLGTFGYVLRMRVRTIPAKRYVVATHTQYKSPQALVAAMLKSMNASSRPGCRHGGGEATIDFLDAAMYSASDGVLIEGCMSDEGPSDGRLYSLQATGVPYAVLAQRGGKHWFELLDYIYRWDPDGYFSTFETPEWTRDPLLRRVLATLFPWFHRSDWLREVFSILWEFDLKVEGSHMYVDYVAPLQGAARHFDWFEREVDLYPLYLAPIGLDEKPLVDYTLWQAVFPSVDIGVGYGPMGKYGSNRKLVIETRRKMEEYLGRVEGGTRLQSTNINLGDTDEFWGLFPANARSRYLAAKAKFDPEGLFPGIVEKLR